MTDHMIVIRFLTGIIFSLLNTNSFWGIPFPALRTLGLKQPEREDDRLLLCNFQVNNS
jgi:hypothetical protein